MIFIIQDNDVPLSTFLVDFGMHLQNFQLDEADSQSRWIDINGLLHVSASVELRLIWRSKLRVRETIGISDVAELESLPTLSTPR